MSHAPIVGLRRWRWVGVWAQSTRRWPRWPHRKQRPLKVTGGSSSDPPPEVGGRVEAGVVGREPVIPGEGAPHRWGREFGGVGTGGGVPPMCGIGEAGGAG